VGAVEAEEEEAVEEVAVEERDEKREPLKIAAMKMMYLSLCKVLRLVKLLLVDGEKQKERQL
jgi:hypothetical protein